MKSILIVLALFSTNTAFADDACSSISNLASKIMEARQDGVSMEEAIAPIQDSKIQELNKIVKMLFISAYETPVFDSEEYKQKTINEFKNKTYLSCFKGIMDRK